MFDEKKTRRGGVDITMVGLGGDIPEEIKEMIQELGTKLANGVLEPQTRKEHAAEISQDELIELHKLQGVKVGLQAAVTALEHALDLADKDVNKWWEKIRSKYGLDNDKRLTLRHNSRVIDRVIPIEEPAAGRTAGPLN